MCGGYHATHTCRQVQNVRYYDELGHCNPCFDQNGLNWNNFYTYYWDAMCAYNDSPCFMIININVSNINLNHLEN